MGTRSAPMMLLFLTACMTAEGGPSSGAGMEGAAPETVVAVPPSVPVSLPAIPRMRPKPPRKTASAPAPARSDAAPAKAEQAMQELMMTGAGSPAGQTTGTPGPTPDDTWSEATSAGGAESGEVAAAAADVESQAIGETADQLPDDPDTTVTDAASRPPPDDVSPPGDGSGAAPPTELAVLPVREPDRGIDVESLFDGDVVRYCAAMWQMGEYIGAARRRGEPFKEAIAAAVQRIAAEKQLPLDNRLAFSGQVYGRLVYRLEDTHAARTLGTYVHFACLTVRGDKKIVPADPNAERLLNSGLAHCESTTLTRDGLNDCIFRELTPIVERRNG
ncbi:MAG: hypothetical protein JSU82_11100 [Rhodospirillales bacterium]|nr:MAG: hypothetical protein JSU82_11100 [Rhodospirillales bacterium]